MARHFEVTLCQSIAILDIRRPWEPPVDPKGDIFSAFIDFGEVQNVPRL